MELNKLELQALFEIALNQKINSRKEVGIPEILNLYKTKLKCFYANLYELGKQTSLRLDTDKLSLEFNKNVKKFTKEVDNSNNNARYKKLGEHYFYALPLYKNVCILLVRKNMFSENMFLQLIKVASNLGLEIKQYRDKERLQLLENFLDKSLDSVQISHESGQLFYINEVASKRLGIKKSEVQNYYVSDFEKNFKNKANEWKKHIDNLKNVGQVIIEGEHINQNKIHSIPVEVNVNLANIKDKNFVIAFSRDITKRKEQEQKLIQTTQKLESIFNEMTDMVYSIKTPSNEVLFVTPSINSILEVDEKEFMNNPNICLNILYSENKDLLLTIENDLELYGAFSIITKIKTKSGKIKWIKNDGKYIYDKNLKPIRLDGVITDITNEHLIAKELDNEIKLQDALIDIAATYINLEPKHLNDTINKSLEKMGRFVNADRAYIFDYDFKENTTSNTFEWCKEGISPEIDNLQKVPIEAIPQWIEKHKNGDSFYIENVALLNEDDPNENALKSILAPQNIKSLLTIPILSNKELIGFVGFDYVENTHSYIEKEKKVLALFGMMLINIRNRQKLNNQLRIEGEKFQNIITNMNLGLLELDLDHKVIFANQSFCDMSGYELHQLKRKNADKIFSNTTISTDKYYKENNQNSRNYEIKVHDKNGNLKWLFVSTAANYNDKGELIGWIRIHLDITKQKKLEHKIAKAISSERAASKAKELFLANMSHEIRTPLNVIIGMIRELNRENLNANQQFYVSQSGKSAKHLLMILNNILDITKIESGEMEIVKKVFNPSAMIYDVHAILTSQAQEKNIKFILDINPDIHPSLVGDDIRIKQVLINLVRNSIKFTNQGSIHLKVAIIHNCKQSQTLRFEVADTGIGMSNEFIAKMFEKFSQEQNTSNREYEGTGLGMPISNDLIKLMGSELIISSVKNKGTNSYFDLTLEKKNQNNSNSNIQQVKQDAYKGHRVLLVEDNEMNRFITIKSLDYLGFATTEAKNGLIATKLIEKQNFDLILMDIQMPIMDGVEATKIIRNNLKIQTPIIALTANAFKRDIDLYLKIGMNAYITKPFAEKVLFRNIQSVLEGSKDGKKLKHRVLEKESTNIEEEPLFDLSEYKNSNGIDDEFIKKMVSLFISLADENIVLLEKALEVDNVVTIRKIIHKIKPNIEVMGILSLENHIKEILKFNVNSTITPKFKSNTKKVIQVLKATSKHLKNEEIS